MIFKIDVYGFRTDKRLRVFGEGFFKNLKWMFGMIDTCSGLLVSRIIR